MTGGEKYEGNGEKGLADSVSDEFRNNLEAYHQLFINGPVVIFKWRNRVNWPVDYVSPNVKDIIGYAPEEFLSQHINFASLIHKEDVHTVTSELLYYCKMGIGDFNHAPYRIHKKDGTWIWISEHRCALKDERGRITHFVGYIIDITDWKRSDAERHLLNGGKEGPVGLEGKRGAGTSFEGGGEGYKTLAEYISDGIMVIQNGVIVYVNYALSSIFGYLYPRQLTGKHVESLLCDQLWDQLKGEAKNRCREIGETEYIQARCLTRKGDEIRVEASADTIHWQSRKAILITVKDITERVKNQADLENRAEILRRENLRLKSSIRDRFRLGNIVGKSEAMQAVYGTILKASESDANVVVCGESGTGKELVARAVHQLSDRSHNPFVVVNCGAVPEKIIESEFFGYKKGAFTGADSDKPGYLDRAEGGFLFLDEVGEITLSMQVKLLRAIDGGGYTPVGGNDVKQPDIRIIAATHRDLAKLVKEGGFRADFYYRINVIPVTLPPLRERREDIPLLVEHMMASYGEGEALPPLTPAMMDVMLNHHWPGNIRELRNVLHRYLTLKKFDLMESPTVFNPEEEEVGALVGGRDLKSIMAEYEKKVILKALDENCWHRGKVASLLSIDRKTLFTKIKSYHLKKN